MTKHYTDKEIDALLKRLTIICDTREQVNAHVTGYFDKNKIPYQSRKLNIGDYSATLENNTLEYDIVCEKKNGLDELCGNMTADRDRFEREFLRAKAFNTKVFLIIENASWSDILLHNYQSKMLPKSLIGTLLSWQIRFNITVLFCLPSETGKIIYGLLYYAAKEALKSGTAI